MPETIDMREGGYRFIPAVFQYSGGVAALPDYAIERVRFARPVPLRRGFQWIDDYLHRRGRPRTAFCACELRSPEPFSEDGFRSFNEAYAGVLSQWGIYDGETNPVARANVCPEYDKPPEPCFHAFSFTIESPDAPPSFVVSGSGEAPEGQDNYRDHIVARGDVSEAGMRRKVHWVLDEMERRMAALGAGWADTTAVQVYSVHDIHPFVGDAFSRRGALSNGITWHFNRPPVRELEFEMDCRSIGSEWVVPAS